MTISFEYIKSLFDDTWDVGVISAEQLMQCGMSPIKQTTNTKSANFTNAVHFQGLTNCIVLIKNGDTWDYSHYDEALEIFKKSEVRGWFEIYTNYKVAAILAGLGVKARNSLIYTYKFGFDCHIAVIGIKDEIIDLPKNRRVNDKLWKRCEGCDDCRKACPVGAIHNEGDPSMYWIDSMKCDNFLGFSDHPIIPSIKKFWHENVYPEISKEKIKKIKTAFDVVEMLGQHSLGTFPWDRNGYVFDGNVTRKDGLKVNIPVCRECTSQPKCSKWSGKYPYDKIAKQEEIKPIFFKRGWTKSKDKQ